MNVAGKSDSMNTVLVLVEDIFRNKIAFNRLIGLDVALISETGEPDVKVTFSMRPELIGNFTRGILHGGVICSALDVVGGLAVYAELSAEDEDSNQRPTKDRDQTLIERFSRLSTIDLRVDFLRPGTGNHFVATAQMLRTGSRVAVVRMDLHNDSGEHIAAATASYSIG